MFFVDEITENKARLIDGDGAVFVVEFAVLPPGTKEGDVLQKCGDTFMLLEDETRKRAQEIAKLIDGFKK